MFTTLLLFQSDFWNLHLDRYRKTSRFLPFAMENFKPDFSNKVYMDSLLSVSEFMFPVSLSRFWLIIIQSLQLQVQNGH